MENLAVACLMIGMYGCQDAGWFRMEDSLGGLQSSLLHKVGLAMVRLGCSGRYPVGIPKVHNGMDSLGNLLHCLTLLLVERFFLVPEALLFIPVVSCPPSVCHWTAWFCHLDDFPVGRSLFWRPYLPSSHSLSTLGKCSSPISVPHWWTCCSLLVSILGF